MTKQYMNPGLNQKSLLAEEMIRFTDELVEKEYGGSTNIWSKVRADEFASVSIEDLLFDQYFLDAKEWLWDKNAEIIFDLWEERKKRSIRLAIILGSIGNGKTVVMSILSWLLWFELTCLYREGSIHTIPQEYFSLRPDSKIAIISLSKTVEKAKDITFNEVKNSFTNQFNRDYFPFNPRIKTRLDIARNNTLIFPNTATQAGVLGYSVYCLSGNQKILLSEGKSVKIRELENQGELNLKGFDVKCNQFIEVRAKDIIKTGVKEVFEVELEDGSKIECTEDHPFLIYKYDNKRKDYVFEYKPLNKITSKDEILTEKDFVKCELCENLYTQINQTHLKKYHKMTIKEYKSKFPDSLVVSPLISYRISKIRKEKYPHGSRVLGWHCSDETKRKLSESNKGKIVSKETRKRMSDFQKGKILSEEHKNKIVKNLIHDKGVTYEERYGTERANQLKKNMSDRIKGKTYEEIYGVERAKEIRKKLSEQRKGKKNVRYGKPAAHGRISYYKGYRMRSSWEVKVAEYLDSNYIEWEYESKTFELVDYDGTEMTYTPDFYLNYYDLYLEIKGFWRDKSFKKYSLFAEDYNTLLIQKREIQNLDFLGELLEQEKEGVLIEA